MEAHLRKKVSLDAAAENSSADSLSFAGLLCIQDQQHSKSPATKSDTQINKQEPEFEFSCAASETNTNDPKNKNSPPDVMIPNGQIKLQGFLIQSKQNQANSKGLSTPTRGGGGKKTSNDSPAWIEVSDQPRNQAKKKHAATSSGFGQKIFRTFVSPCRRCRAIEPSMKLKTQMVPAENVKSH